MKMIRKRKSGFLGSRPALPKNVPIATRNDPKATKADDARIPCIFNEPITMYPNAKLGPVLYPLKSDKSIQEKRPKGSRNQSYLGCRGVLNTDERMARGLPCKLCWILAEHLLLKWDPTSCIRDINRRISWFPSDLEFRNKKSFTYCSILAFDVDYHDNRHYYAYEINGKDGFSRIKRWKTLYMAGIIKSS